MSRPTIQAGLDPCAEPNVRDGEAPAAVMTVGASRVSAGFAGRCGILPAASPQNERPEDEPGRHEDGERRYGRHDVAAAPA